MVEKCPHCGAAWKQLDEIGNIWECESDDAWGKFRQSDRCRIAELEDENARLREQLKTPNPARDIANEANELLAAKDREIARLQQSQEIDDRRIAELHREVNRTGRENARLQAALIEKFPHLEIIHEPDGSRTVRTEDVTGERATTLTGPTLLDCLRRLVESLTTEDES